MRRPFALGAVALLLGLPIPAGAARAGDCPTCNPAPIAPAPCASCGSIDPFACAVRGCRHPSHWWLPTPGWGHHGRQYLGDSWTARMMGGHVAGPIVAGPIVAGPIVDGPVLPGMPTAPVVVGP